MLTATIRNHGQDRVLETITQAADESDGYFRDRVSQAVWEWNESPAYDVYATIS
jgi:hypothetical protein